MIQGDSVQDSTSLRRQIDQLKATNQHSGNYPMVFLHSDQLKATNRSIESE